MGIRPAFSHCLQRVICKRCIYNFFDLPKDLQFVESKEDFKSRWKSKEGRFHSKNDFKAKMILKQE